MSYLPGSPTRWTGRDDGASSQVRRWHQRVQNVDLSLSAPPPAPDGGVVLLGFCSDEGVRRNGGRVGAAEGPQTLRRALGSLPDHLPEGFLLADAGDVVVEDGDLEAARQLQRWAVATIARAGLTPVVLGGGHEVAWGTWNGLADIFGGASSVGIVNLDAHLDLREPSPLPTSGTPFLEFARACAHDGGEFRYACVGAQRHANTRLLFDRADALGACVVDAIAAQGPPDEVLFRASAAMDGARAVHLTICLDVADVAFAPGVSAPTSGGLFPRQVATLIDRLIRRNPVRALDIAELNPQHDTDGKTARMAAMWIEQAVYSLSLRAE